MNLDTEYERRLARVVQRYGEEVGPDGGYGVTRGQPSSLVNTSEVLFVLRCAQRRVQPYDLAAVDDALAFLATHLPAHCQTRTATGGRGEKTRFVVFALLGLAHWPDRLTDLGQRTASWGLSWLEQHLLEDGLPEDAGVRDVSLFENAVTIDLMVRMLPQPYLALPDKARAERVLERCVTGSLYHLKPDLTWPRQSYGEGTSPAKTSLLTTAFSNAKDAGLIDGPVRVGGATIEPRLVDVSEVIARSGDWLCSNVARWERYIEHDPDITGTIWVHLAYAQALEALATIGRGLDSRLTPAWEAVRKSWNQQERSWCEVKDPPVATVRSDYWSVRALEALLLREGASGARELGQRMDSGPPETRAPKHDLVSRDLDQFSLRSRADRTEIPLRLTRRQADLMRALVLGGAQDKPLQADELAGALHIAANSLGQYIRRLNEAISNHVPDLILIVSGRRNGYRLNVRAVLRD